MKKKQNSPHRGGGRDVFLVLGGMWPSAENCPDCGGKKGKNPEGGRSKRRASKKKGKISTHKKKNPFLFKVFAPCLKGGEGEDMKQTGSFLSRKLAKEGG